MKIMSLVLALCSFNCATVETCDVQDVEGGALITCGSTEAFVENGDRGPTGQDGDAGLDVTAKITCEGPVGSTKYRAEYTTIRLSNGDALVSARLTSIYYSVSHVDYRLNGQPETVALYLELGGTRDWSWFELSYDDDAGVLSAVYHDSDNPEPIVWTVDGCMTQFPQVER